MENVEVQGLEEEGVVVISPLVKDFDARVETLAPSGMVDVVKDAKPYS